MDPRQSESARREAVRRPAASSCTGLLQRCRGDADDRAEPRPSAEQIGSRPRTDPEQTRNSEETGKARPDVDSSCVAWIEWFAGPGGLGEREKMNRSGGGRSARGSGGSASLPVSLSVPIHYLSESSPAVTPPGFGPDARRSSSRRSGRGGSDRGGGGRR